MRGDHILTFGPLWRLEEGKDRNMRVPHEIHKSFVSVCFGKEALCFACKCINVWRFDLRSMTEWQTNWWRPRPLLINWASPKSENCQKWTFRYYGSYRYLSNGIKKWWTIWNRCNIATGIRYNGLTCCFITPPNMGSYHREGNGPHLLGQFCFYNVLLLQYWIEMFELT